MAQADELYTVEEAAAYLDVTVGWMRQLRSGGGGPLSWREGRRLVYPRSGLDRYRAQVRERTVRGSEVTA